MHFYYWAQGEILTCMEIDLTLDYIKNCHQWKKAIGLTSHSKEMVYSWFVEQALDLKNGASFCYSTDKEKIGEIPFYFLLEDNKIIACAAQEIINGKLQPVAINWYIE